MNVCALVSGGKDSILSLLHCIQQGHTVVALAHLHSPTHTELDSHMYQTVGYPIVEQFSRAFRLPLYQATILGELRNPALIYNEEKGDEVEDLYELLSRVQSEVGIDAVCSGAILSTYQRTRVENVCSRLNIISLAYLWQLDETEILNQVEQLHIDARIVKIATMGLYEQHLGKKLSEIKEVLHRLDHPSGEGGEFETVVLDCPIMYHSIEVKDWGQPVHTGAGSAFLPILSVQLHEKRSVSAGNCGILPSAHQLAMNSVDLFRSTNTNTVCTNKPTTSSDLRCQDKMQTKLYKSGSGIFTLQSACYQSEPGCLHEDTNAFFRQVKQVLIQSSLTVNDVMLVYLNIRDMEHYNVLNQSYIEYFLDLHKGTCANPPARVCISSPLYEDMILTLHVVGFHKQLVLSDSDDKVMVHRDSLWVRSISYWAPANIGPYSQAQTCGGLIYVAGQIPLVPGTMEMLSAGFTEQCLLALNHTEKVAKTFIKGKESVLQNIYSAVCYIVNEKHVCDVTDLWQSLNVVGERNKLLLTVTVDCLPKFAPVEWQITYSKNPVVFHEIETGDIAIKIGLACCVNDDFEVEKCLYIVKLFVQNYEQSEISLILKKCIQNISNDLNRSSSKFSFDSAYLFISKNTLLDSKLLSFSFEHCLEENIVQLCGCSIQSINGNTKTTIEKSCPINSVVIRDKDCIFLMLSFSTNI